jgi:hypothetical protein
MMNILEDDQMMGQPPQPIQWSWITQRQGTDGKASSIWKFGFVAPDGGEVRVTFHQIQNPTPEQSTPPAPDPNNPSPMGGAQGASSQDVVPAGQPNPDQTNDGVFYVTFFCNRNPEHMMKWDVSLSHEDSLVVWLTITHGLVDFLRKAGPKNLVLDDLGNGKLKMVLRSVSMDVVATDPEYTLEITKKHEYRSFYQIKKGGSGSAFDQMVSGKDNEGDTKGPQPVSPVAGAEKAQPADNSQDAQGNDPSQDKNSKPGDGVAPESNQSAGSPLSPENPSEPKPIDEPKPPVETKTSKGMTVEIGRKDYSVTVKDRMGNVVDRFRGKNPLDILRWINTKGYGSNKMKVVDQEQPSGPIEKNRNPQPKPQDANPEDKNKKDDDDDQDDMKNEQFVIDGKKIVVRSVFEAKRAAEMNTVINADRVRSTMEAVEFEFSTDKDMNFKRALVELAFKQTEH